MRSVASTLLVVAVATAATTAGAQAAPPTPSAPGAAPAQPSAAEPDRATPIARQLLPTVHGGITAEQVGARAAATSYQALAAEETATGAAAKTESAWVGYLPRVGLKASYTRLSDFTPPSFGGVRFPMVLDQWLTQATVLVPVTDYFLRINQSYTAATRQEEAARWDVVAARAKSFSDGKIAYYTWLRALGGMQVAEQNLAVAEAHLKDAKNQFSVGNASKADVLRAETQVASATLLVERARSGIVIAERQVRVAIHAKEDETLTPGETLDGPLSAAPQNVRALVSEALAARPEIKSIDKNADATRKLAAVQRAAKYPALSGVGEVTYANPNQRKFPQTSQWFPTWSVGAQITWSPNDFITAGPLGTELEQRAAALEAQKSVTRDGVELEVTQAYQGVVEADTAITTTTSQLASAEEGYRVARELFNAGRGTATTLIDAEVALAQTRFEHLQAEVDARLARIRLAHAVGRDVK